MPALPTPVRSQTTRRTRTILAALGAASLLLSATTVAAHAAGDPLVLDHQHTDAVSIRYESDTLVLKTRADLDSGAGTVLDPDDVLFHITDALQRTVPDLADYAFLGEPGTTVWTIPQSYQPGVLWAGWETESLPRGTFADDRVRLDLQAVTGPGRMELYLNDIDGPQRLLSSTDESLRAIVEHVGAHTHANWVFDAPGIYTLTFVAQAERVGGGTARSQPQTYTFRVGAAEAVPSPSVTSPAPEPSATATPTPTPNTSPTPTTTPSPSPSQTTTPDASPVPTGTQTPGPAAAAEQAVPECIPTPVTTTVRPDNVDVVDAGHFDFGPVLDGGTLHALVKDDRAAPASWVDPGTLVFHLGDAAAADAPGGQFAFLGSGRIWQIPLTQQAGVPWLGWNTQHPSIAGHAQGQVTLTLEGLDGPGDLAVYSVDSWGQLGEKYFGTVGGFPRSTSIDVGASGVHVHGIWAFTAPGAYHADLTFAGTIDGERVSATTTLTFFAGAGDPRSAVRERTVTTYVGRTADGEECDTALAATGFADPETAADLSGLAGVLVLVGLAFVGAAALAPRTRERRERPAS